MVDSVMNGENNEYDKQFLKCRCHHHYPAGTTTSPDAQGTMSPLQTRYSSFPETSTMIVLEGQTVSRPISDSTQASGKMEKNADEMV